METIPDDVVTLLDYVTSYDISSSGVISDVGVVHSMIMLIVGASWAIIGLFQIRTTHDGGVVFSLNFPL